MTRLSRARLRLGIGAILACWVAIRVLPAMVDGIRDVRWEAADRTRRLEQSRREIGREPEILAAAAAAREQLVAASAQLLPGESAAQANDALSGLVNLAADRASARLSGSSPEVDSAAVGSLRRVSLRAAFDCDIRGLVTLLHTLAEEEVVLVADGLRVLAAEAGGNPAGPEVLRVELTVRGWYQEGNTGSPP